MKFIALIIGIVFALGLQAQNIKGLDNYSGNASVKKVKISRLKSGYGISKEQSSQVEIKEVSLSAGNIVDRNDEKGQDLKNTEKRVIRKSYYKAGFKVDNSFDTGYIPKASTVLE